MKERTISEEVILKFIRPKKRATSVAELSLSIRKPELMKFAVCNEKFNNLSHLEIQR